ncbi:MAG TPA: GatB/YqeY domain-containing protein [Salinisphaeraceae bacterium]|nr:GatB/YqeY domain-containing protein [Salinisphaeraceae bacterium]
MSLKDQLRDDMKRAMRERDKARLSVIRMLQAAIKQREVDDQTELDDTAVLAVIDKMVKQRRDAEAQYQAAGRTELAAAEAAEIAVLQAYLPAQLTPAEIDQAITAAIDETGASSMRDMGRVMGVLKPRLQGQADMGEVSKRLKSRLQ